MRHSMDMLNLVLGVLAVICLITIICTKEAVAAVVLLIIALFKAEILVYQRKNRK